MYMYVDTIAVIMCVPILEILKKSRWLNVSRDDVSVISESHDDVHAVCAHLLLYSYYIHN